MVWACVAKEDNDWVKKCMAYKVEGSRPTGRPEGLEIDCAKTVKHVN